MSENKKHEKTKIEQSTPTTMPTRINMAGCTPMQFTGNLSLNWKKFKQAFKIYLRAASLDDEDDCRKVALFLHFIGEKGVEVFNSFGVDVDSITLASLIKLCEEHFVPKTNVTFEAHKFFTYKQQADESIEDFVAALKNKSQTCQFSNLQDRLVKDIFICNMHDKYKYIKEKLLLEEKLNLDETVEFAKTIFQTSQRANTLTSSEPEQSSVLYMQKNKSNHKNRSKSQIRYNNYSQSQNKSQSQEQPKSTSKQVCGKCGQVHRFKCPAQGVVCRSCGIRNHFESMCRNRRNVRNIQVDAEPDELFIGHIKSYSKCSTDWSLPLIINNVNITAVLDTGSDANVMSYKVFKSLNVNVLIEKCKNKVMSYSGDKIPVIGECLLTIQYNLDSKNMSNQVKFIIANVNSPTVIGHQTCSTLGLVHRVYQLNNGQSISQQSHNESKHELKHLLNSHKSVFEGLGCIPGLCHISVREEVSPKVDAPRKVPFALYNKLKKELQNMEDMQVIVKVTEPTEWVSSLLLVEKKNGKLRVCLDPRNLNEAICRSHYPIPTVDMIRSKVAGSKWFSTLDASSGFWMCSLDEESSYLTTFNTPFGRYRFKRLPYGINCAPEYFHRVMTETFGDIPGVTVYSDDLMVSGETLAQHNERLSLVFERAKKVNVKFNKSKCTFATQQVKYLGHIFSGDGITPDPDKVRAIKDMPSPSCTKDLQRFLGLLNYLSPFIPNLASEVSQLRDLLKKDAMFMWNDNYEQVFNCLKSLICSAPVLGHFDVNENITLSVDASSTAVGAVLLQNGHPIYYASKTLTPTQQRMAQIEKELYAIVFGCIRFHQFIYGQVVTVETDHRPLITLFKKPLVEVPTRLQRMMMKIQAYSLEVCYKRGTEMYIADTLSRAALPESSSDELDDDVIVHVNMLIKNLPVSSERLQWLKTATSADDSMQILKTYCKKGWPACKKQVNKLVQEYWNFRSEIHTEAELLFRGNSIIIPKKIRPDILKIIHSGHLGVDRSKSFARGIVFWPFMSTEIKNLIESCHSCLKHRNANPAEPMQPHELPTLPWEKVGVDFFDCKGKKYVIIEDYYSNYIEISIVPSTSAKALIMVLKSVFSRHGIPVILQSDNGPPFSSAEFKSFIYDWGIQHTTSSPYLSRSNGLAESGVKIAKKILTKCDETGTDPYLALLQYRTTPRGKIASPAQLLMSRSLRTQLPTVSRNLKSKVVKFNDHIETKNKNIEKMKQYYDKNTKSLSTLQEGEEVLYKKTPESVWSPARIKKKCIEPRSYIVETPDGSECRRNRQHLLKLPSPTKSSQVQLNEPVSNDNQTVPITQQLSPLVQSASSTEQPSSLPVTPPVPGNVQSPFVTRSGRTIKPVQRFVN